MQHQHKKTPQVLCIGGVVRDIFTRPTQTKVITLQDPTDEEQLLCFPHGGKAKMATLEFTRGGGGSNTAMGFTRMGIPTVLVGSIGQDEVGATLQRELEEEGLDCSFLQQYDQAKTGLSVVINSFDGERTILLHRGANELLNPAKIPFDALTDVQWLYLSSLSGDFVPLLEKIVSYVTAHRIRLVFNPGEAQLTLGASRLGAVLKATTILMINREEAEELLSMRAFEYIQAKEHGTVIEKKQDNTVRMLQKLYTLGPRIVIITQGKDGTVVYDGTSIYTLGIYPQRVIDTLGAGDGFGAAFVAGLIKKANDIDFALRLGTANAASVVSSYGAQEGLLTYEQATKFMEKHSNVVVKKEKMKN